IWIFMADVEQYDLTFVKQTFVILTAPPAFFAGGGILHYAAVFWGCPLFWGFVGWGLAYFAFWTYTGADFPGLGQPATFRRMLRAIAGSAGMRRDSVWLHNYPTANIVNQVRLQVLLFVISSIAVGLKLSDIQSLYVP